MVLKNVHAGYESVYRIMGMEKEAGIPPGLLSKLKGAGGFLKRLAIGEPGKFVKEVKGGKVFAPGSTIRSMFALPSFRKHPIKASLMGGLFYGLPAYEGYQIATDDEPNKGARMGGMLGGTALGWAALGPGGILASIPAGMAGEWAGGALGKGVDKITGGSKPRVVMPTAPNVVSSPDYFQRLRQQRPLTDPQQWAAQGYR